MQQLVSVYLFFVPILLGLLMLWQHSRGTVPLLSLRNFSLLGLIVFQYFSGGLHLWSNDFVDFPVADPEGSGLIYALILTAFTILYLVVYHIGWPAKQISRAVPITRTVPSDATLLILAMLLMIIGLGLRYVPIPYIGIIANYFGFGLIAVAAGFAGWTVARHYLNPIYLGLGSAIFAFASVASVLGEFGRRGLVAAAASFVWGAFYGRLRLIKTRWLVVALLVLSIPGIYLTAAFTATRSVVDRRSTAGTLLRGMANPRFEDSIPALLSGQSCGPASMFVIETYPSVNQGNFLNSITYFFVLPVPRAMWPDKPLALSNEIAQNALMRGVNRKGITIPPGVVGYIAAEGGIVALFAFALFFGLMIRFFDQLIVRAPWNPLIIMPVGSALGQILGLFRGEMGIFMFIHTTSFVGSYVACVFIGRFLDRAIGSSLPHDDPAEVGGHHLSEGEYEASHQDDDVFNDADYFAEELHRYSDNLDYGDRGTTDPAH